MGKAVDKPTPETSDVPETAVAETSSDLDTPATTLEPAASDAVSDPQVTVVVTDNTVPTEPDDARQHARFANMSFEVTTLLRQVASYAQERGTHGRRWALIHTHLENALFHAHQGHKESEAPPPI